eukprot:2471614-Lingulodinium_polyedra.AAC.1
MGRVPAVTLADQEKPFEKIRQEWLMDTFQRWQLPDWAMAVAEALIAGRRVVANINGERCPVRSLKRSVGM